MKFQKSALLLSLALGVWADHAAFAQDTKQDSSRTQQGATATKKRKGSKRHVQKAAVPVSKVEILARESEKKHSEPSKLPALSPKETQPQSKSATNPSSGAKQNLTAAEQKELSSFTRWGDRSDGVYGADRDSSGAGSYSGKGCKLPQLDYSKFDKSWGKALMDRMSGRAPVQTENGHTLDGGMDFTSIGQGLAKDIGCPVPDRGDSEGAHRIVAAVVIAIACPESDGWNPKAKLDERKFGGVAGADKSAEANESRGLLQMTKKSDLDRNNGCHLNQQSDLDGPITNLMCGLAKIKAQNYSSLDRMGKYWSVARKSKMADVIAKAVRHECQEGFPNIKSYTENNAKDDTKGPGQSGRPVQR